MKILEIIFGKGSLETTGHQNYQVARLQESADRIPNDLAIRFGVIKPLFRVATSPNSDYWYLVRDVEQRLLDKVFVADLTKRIPIYVLSVPPDKSPQEIIKHELRYAHLADLYFGKNDFIGTVCDIMRDVSSEPASGALRTMTEFTLRHPIFFSQIDKLKQLPIPGTPQIKPTRPSPRLVVDNGLHLQPDSL